MRLALTLIAAIALSACATSGLYEPVYEDGLYDAAQTSDASRDKPAR